MIHLVYGPNHHKKDQILLSIRQKAKGFAYNIFDVSEEQNTKSALQALIYSVSLFDSSQKIIHIKEFESFEKQDYLLNLLEKERTNSELIIICDSNNMLRSNARILKFFTPSTIAVCNDYTRQELRGVIEKVFQEASIPSSLYTDFLLEHVAQDPYVLENEAHKLIIYHEIDGNARPEDIVSVTAQYDIWEYLRYLTKGDKLHALIILESLLDKGENIFGILGLVMWNIRMFLIIRSSSASDMQIAKDFAYNPYALKQAQQTIAHFPLKKIQLIYEKVTELEYKIKSGSINERLGLILLTFLF